MPDTPTETLPTDHFTTRDGKLVALKPWTLGLIAQHADTLGRFVAAWVAMATGGQVSLNAIQEAMPALEASVQDPASLEKVGGLAELIRLVEAVWAFNEIGVGMGKAVALSAQIHQGMLTAGEGHLNLIPDED